MENDSVYQLLIYLYLDVISSWEIEELVNEECKRGKTQREAHAHFFALWIPSEKFADKLLAKIQELIEEGR